MANSDGTELWLGPRYQRHPNASVGRRIRTLITQNRAGPCNVALEAPLRPKQKDSDERNRHAQARTPRDRRVLAALETAAHRLDAGQPLNPSFFILASDFIQGFADGCHHRKEEGILFPAMEAAGFPSEAGPIAVMLAEHNLGRQLTAAMRAAAESIAAGDASARGPLIQAASDYAALLWQHIAKEENILFPMADSALDGPSQAKVAADFARVEEETGAGVHDRFLALAQTLERQATA